MYVLPPTADWGGGFVGNWYSKYLQGLLGVYSGLMLFRGRRAHFRFGQVTFNASHIIYFAYYVPS